MRHATLFLSALFLLPAVSMPVVYAQRQNDSALLGFSTANAKTELDLEKRFDAIPDPERMRANMKLLSARPHHVGSPYDKQDAEWILTQYKQWGWDAHIETFQVLFPTPKTRLLEMDNFRATLEEPAVAGDPTSNQKDEQLPTYTAYSPDGDVTAPLSFHNLETRIVRIFNTYGPRMRLNDGRALPAFIGQALRGEDLTVFGDGSQTRSFCYVDDLIEGIYRLLMSDYALPVNIGNPSEITLRDFAEEVIALTGTDRKIIYKPLPADDPKQRKPDISKAKKILQWEPKVGRKEGLKITYDYFKSLPPEEWFKQPKEFKSA